MVKNKKMSKTSIAVIVLALLLVLSLVMGMTGAWFTDREAPAATSLNFGTINISVSASQMGVYRGESALSEQDVMPGDHIKVNLTVAKATPASDEDFYWVVKITTTVNGNNVGSGTNAWVGAAASAAFENGDALASPIDIELDPEVYGNAYQGQAVVVGYEVRAIQKANVASASAAYTLLTGESLDWSTDVGGHNSTGLPTA